MEKVIFVRGCILWNNSNNTWDRNTCQLDQLLTDGWTIKSVFTPVCSAAPYTYGSAIYGVTGDVGFILYKKMIDDGNGD